MDRILDLFKSVPRRLERAEFYAIESHTRLVILRAVDVNLLIQPLSVYMRDAGSDNLYTIRGEICSAQMHTLPGMRAYFYDIIFQKQRKVRYLPACSDGSVIRQSNSTPLATSCESPELLSRYTKTMGSDYRKANE